MRADSLAMSASRIRERAALRLSLLMLKLRHLCLKCICLSPNMGTLYTELLHTCIQCLDGTTGIALVQYVYVVLPSISAYLEGKTKGAQGVTFHINI